MTRVLITRLGGVGDLLFIEPSIRAIYEKYAPCEIVFRTYLYFYSALEYHPLITDIVCDTNEYYLGYHGNLEYNESVYWRHVNPKFDIHIDLQGIIEKGIDLDHEFEKHAVQIFANQSGVEVSDIVPQVPYLKKNVPSYNIVAQLTSDGEDKCLDENKDILKTLSEYENVHFLGKEKIDYQEFVSVINNCNLFIGTESCGITIARSLNKKTIGFFTNRIRKRKLSFDKMTSLTFNETHKLKDAIDEYSI